MRKITKKLVGMRRRIKRERNKAQGANTTGGSFKSTNFRDITTNRIYSEKAKCFCSTCDFGSPSPNTNGALLQLHREGEGAAQIQVDQFNNVRAVP